MGIFLLVTARKQKLFEQGYANSLCWSMAILSVPVVRYVYDVYAVPQQPPEIVSASSSPTSLHLKWKSPFFIGAPLIGYRLTISGQATAGSRTPSPSPTTRVKELVVQSGGGIDEIFSEVVTSLRPDVSYQVTLAALNQYGVGPAAVVSVRTPALSSSM
jgi:Fibronectin type III domain